MVITEQQFEENAVYGFSFGDLDHPVIFDKQTMIDKYCPYARPEFVAASREFVTKHYGSSPMAMKLMEKLSGSIPIIHIFCGKVSKGLDLDRVLSVVKELNAKNVAMAPARQGLTRALSEAARPGTDYKVSDVVCFIKKWLSETEKLLPFEQKWGFKMWVNGFVTFAAGANTDTLSTKCDWPQTQPGAIHFKSIPVLIYRALVNLDKQ